MSCYHAARTGGAIVGLLTGIEYRKKGAYGSGLYLKK